MNEVGTEVPAEPAITGDASPIPSVFYWSLWVPAFCVLAYILIRATGADRGPPEPLVEDEVQGTDST